MKTKRGGQLSFERLSKRLRAQKGFPKNIDQRLSSAEKKGRRANIFYTSGTQ